MRAIFVSLGLMIMVPAAALAQTDVSTEMIYECANIDSDAERLTCYDDAVSRFQAAEASGQVAIIDKSDVEQLNRESFGLSLPSIPKNILPKFVYNLLEQIDGDFEFPHFHFQLGLLVKYLVYQRMILKFLLHSF